MLCSSAYEAGRVAGVAGFDAFRFSFDVWRCGSLARQPPSCTFRRLSTTCTAMTDIEPTEGSGDADSGGGFSSFFNSIPKVIGAISGLIVAVSGLLIALNKAGILYGDTPDPKPNPATTTTATTTPPPPSKLFSEFDRPSGSVDIQDSTIYIQAKQPRSPVVALSNQKAPILDVEMSTRAKWQSGAADYGVSLICRRKNPKNYYLLGVVPSKNGVSIAMYRDGRLVPLWSGNNPRVRGQVNELKASCLNDDPRNPKLTNLKLAVKWQVVAVASDPQGLAAGDVGIRVGVGPKSREAVTVAFENFELGR
jgi:hypothetical protein